MTDKIPEKNRKVITYVILPAILVAYAFAGLHEGVDVVDATFTLTGFAYPEKLNAFWRLAYYLPNVLGNLFTRLPYGDTMAGMNAYGSLIIALTALVAYFGLACVRGKGTVTHSFLAFIAILLAESLCWAPRTSLYNYLTYLFMTVGVVLLLIAGEAYYLLILAGVAFGLNVHVRFPNIVQAAFILLVWYDAWRRKETLATAARKTVYCVVGYLIGFGVPLLVIVSQYGAGAYAEMIAALFGMTAGAQDYSAGGMFGAIFMTYVRSAVKMWPLWAAVVVSMLYAGVVGDKGNGWQVTFRTVPFVTSLIALFIMYRQDVFTRSYWYYDSVFELAMAFVILGVIVIVPLLHDAPAFAAILIILITPLGSNNYTFPLINNLFLVAPIVLLAAWKSFRRTDGTPEGNRTKSHSLRGSLHRSLGIALTCVIALLLFQGVLFHTRYAFNDGTDGTPRDAVITAIPRAQGMKTTTENAAALESLYETLAPYRAVESEWAESGNEPWGMIMFGKAPGIPYLMEIEPAVFTSWPDLDTVSVAEWDQALRTVKGFPIIIIKKDPATGEPEITGENLGEEKWKILQDHLERKLYMKKDTDAPFSRYYDLYTSVASSRGYF